MTKAGDRGQEVEALRERIATLTAAILRISASLDLDTVLRDLPAPMRLSDMRSYVAGLGFSTDGVIIDTFQGAPMRHRGVQVGNFFLGEKETGVVLSVPDGRTVSVLLNATPIHANDGAVLSVVATMQDLAPLQELERLRAEFLGLVSHELRTPLTSIMGSTVALLDRTAELDPAEMHEFLRIIQEQAGHMRDLIGDLLDAGRIEAGTLSVAPEPSEVADLVDRSRNTFLSGGGRHTGQGARFTFTLPVAEQTRNVEPPAVSGPHSPHASPETRNPIRILVVDDDPQTLRYVRDALAASGYTPLVTGGHENLSHIIRTEQPQLVLLDLMLPGTDGIELMKSVPELGDLPVVFISGYGRDETIARALESGAADYIVKPFSATELTAYPASRTGSRRTSSPTSRPTPPARRSSATCSPPASACRASTGRSGQRVRSTARRRSTARAGGPHLPGAARRRGGLRSRSARSCR